MSSVELNMGNIEAMFADPAGPVGRIIEEKTIEVEAVAKALILLPGSGGIYKAGALTFHRGSKIYSNYSTGGEVEHQASAAGMPPAAAAAGTLYDSMWHKIGVETTVYGQVGSDAPFIFYLELGTRYMAPRPFLVPALHIVVP